jgi:hypothetical protein
VQGVGPGTVLGSRYALRGRLSQSGDLERWSAHDTTLRRQVELIIIGPEHPNCAGVLDAARRAAGVEDARLVRILDVGTQNDHSFIVKEAMNESESLTTMLQQGPLPAEEARRIAGEAAKALETAGQRGLHHLWLTPHQVLVAPDGAIRVNGVAIAAAIEGPDQQEPATATSSRRDAVCLVAILYAALTSRWPLKEEVFGIEPAPRAVEGVAGPAEIALGVPNDLDALCAETLNKDAGPMTPGEFAGRIAPWPRDRVHRAGVDPTVVLRLPGAGVPHQNVAFSGGTQPTVTLPMIGAATVERPKGPTEAPEPATTIQSPPREPVSARKSAGNEVAGTDEGNAASAASTTSKARGSAWAGAGAVAGVFGSKLTALTRGEDGTGAGSGPTQGGDRAKIPAGFLGFDDVEPPLPLLPASTALPPTRGQSKIVILVVAAFVVLALFLGFKGLFGSLGGGPINLLPGRAAAAPTGKASASPVPRAATTAGGPIAISSATGFDPQGDGVENNSQAANVFDGNPATTWTSELYNTPQFGNLKKGVGLVLDLGKPTTVHQVTINLANGPVDLTVYSATSPDLQAATVLGTASGASGQVQIKAASAIPASQYIIVWFTSLASDGGRFGVSVSEIALS